MKLTELTRAGNLWQWFTWHLCVGSAITLIPTQLLSEEPLAGILPAHVPFLTSFAIAYAAAAIMPPLQY